MRRREFISLVCGAAAWPLAARAQQGERMRRIGVLLGTAETDPEFQTRMAAFREELQRLGWTEDRNVRIDIRSPAGAQFTNSQALALAKGLVASSPDVIVAAAGSPGIIALQQATQTIPVIFVNVTDPVGVGVVTSLSRPSGNMTGFTPFEYGISAKWLELLKQIDPRVNRAGVLRDPTNPTGIGFPGCDAGCGALLRGGTDCAQRARGRRHRARHRRICSRFEWRPDRDAQWHHNHVTGRLSPRWRAGTGWPQCIRSGFLAAGGLISYGPNSVDPYRGAAGYVDRILKGAKPADLPVQAPTKYRASASISIPPRR